MNILITGVHGFVGSNLVKALSSNNIIYGLDIVAPEKEGVAKTFSWDELPQLTNMQINAVIHLAAAGSVVESVINPVKNFVTNAEGTFKVLNALKFRTVPVFFYKFFKILTSYYLLIHYCSKYIFVY